MTRAVPGRARAGHLVADAFAAAGWHEHERVFTIDDGIDSLFLQSPEFLEPKNPVQNVLGCLARI